MNQLKMPKTTPLRAFLCGIWGGLGFSSLQIYEHAHPDLSPYNQNVLRLLVGFIFLIIPGFLFVFPPQPDASILNPGRDAFTLSTQLQNGKRMMLWFLGAAIVLLGGSLLNITGQPPQ